MNKEFYVNSILEKARKELKINSTDYELKAGKLGDKLTLDGVNYFNSILSVEVYYNGTLIAEYNLDKKVLTHFANTNNICTLEKMCDLVNNFVGYIKYGVNYKAISKFEAFRDSIDEGFSVAEAMDMYKHHNFD